MSYRFFQHAAIFLLLLTMFQIGCGGNSRSKYVPQGAKARDALKTVLDAWKSGAKFGPVTSGDGTVNVFESRWRDGKKLESFEILEEVKNPDQPQFKVRIHLEGEAQEMTNYLVIGLDPLNVFRDEDYKQALTW